MLERKRGGLLHSRRGVNGSHAKLDVYWIMCSHISDQVLGNVLEGEGHARMPHDGRPDLLLAACGFFFERAHQQEHGSVL